MVAVLDKAAQDKDTEARLARLMAGYAEATLKAMAPLNESLERLRGAGQTDPATLTGPAEIARCISLLEMVYVMKGLRLKQRQEYRNQLSLYCREAAEYLRFLQQNWESWRNDEVEGRIVVEGNSPELREQHEELYSRMIATDERLLEPETELMKTGKQFRENRQAEFAAAAGGIQTAQ